MIPDAHSVERILQGILEPADRESEAAWGPVGVWGDERRGGRGGQGDGRDGQGVGRGGQPTPAAVLVPFVREDDGGVSVLFTLRTDTVKDHKGQVSFPGGVREPGDATLLETALRETGEEIGLPASGVRVAGRLRPYDTITGYRSHPFVGVVDGRPALTPSAVEIREVFHVALSKLMDPGTFRESRVDWAGKEYTVRAFEWGGPVIWGATANILADLVARLREKGGA